MTASSSRILLTLTVIVSLCNVHVVVGEVPEVNVSDEIARRRQLEHVHDNGNYTQVIVSKTKNIRNLQDPSENKSHSSFWSNVVPFYDSVKNHLTNHKNSLNGMNIDSSSYDNWLYNTPASKYTVKPEQEYPANHLMIPVGNDPESLKKTRYQPHRNGAYQPDNRQDYEDEDGYSNAHDSTYSDNYYPEMELHSPNAYNVWRGPTSPGMRYPYVKMCPCRQAEVRQQLPINCPNGAAFINILTTLGVSFWNLVQLVIASSAPLIFPLLLLKLVIVAFKIYKFIKAIKLVLKLVIFLPFLIRVVLPAIQNMLNQQSVVHLLKMRHDDVSENRQLAFWDLSDLVNAPEVVDCASKTACEIGAFVAAKTRKHLPEKFGFMLRKKVERIEKKKRKMTATKNADEEVFDAFVLAFARNWTHEKCGVYSCSISL